jgi:hypothetical protein
MVHPYLDGNLTAMYPGVWWMSAWPRYSRQGPTPQVVVRIENLSSSSTLDSYSISLIHSTPSCSLPQIGQCQFGVLCFTLEQDVLGFQIWSSAHLVCRVSVLTSMDNALIMQILDCTRDGPDDVLCVPKCQLIQGSKFSLLLVVTTPGADPVK